MRAFNPGLLEDFVVKGVYLQERQLKKWLEWLWVLPEKKILHFGYDLFERIQVDFFHYRFKNFSLLLHTTPRTATHLTFSNKNNE